MRPESDSRPVPKREQEERNEKLEEISRTTGQAEGEREPGSSAEETDNDITRTPGQAEGERSNQHEIEEQQRSTHEEDTKPHQPIH